MRVVDSIKSVREAVGQARQEGKSIGLVPTMGALHAGHMSLVKAAKQVCDYVVVTIFVNPTQFGPNEDFDTYPRTLEQDCSACEEAGVSLVFAPSSQEMYPRENVTWVIVEKLTEPLCGLGRPTHFRGVTTVCTKLFNIVLPDRAFFGQKDAQQVIVLQRMVADLNMPLEIVVCPTVRESDGLAMSSRNQYLSPQERQDATILNRALSVCRVEIEQGQRDRDLLEKQLRKILSEVGNLSIEYASILDVNTLEPMEQVSGRVLVALAVRLGQTRLIDNIVVDVPA